MIGYLVSEFTSGLLGDELLDKLFGLLDPGRHPHAMLNALDIMAETDNERRRALIGEEIRRRFALCDTTGDPSDYVLFLASTAAVFGVDDAEQLELAFLERVGVEEFLKRCFTTRNNFAYYGHQQDRFFVEWTKMIENQRYGRYRCLMCAVLGRLKYAGARPAFQRLVANPDEDAVVQEYAREALQRYGEPVPASLEA